MAGGIVLVQQKWAWFTPADISPQVWPFSPDVLTQPLKHLQILISVNCCPRCQKFRQNHALLVKKHCQHGFTGIPLLACFGQSVWPWASWDPSRTALFGFHFHYRHPGFVTCHHKIHQIRIDPHGSQVFFTKALAEGFLSGCEFFGHQFCSNLGEAKIFLENAMHWAFGDVGFCSQTTHCHSLISPESCLYLLDVVVAVATSRTSGVLVIFEGVTSCQEPLVPHPNPSLRHGVIPENCPHLSPTINGLLALTHKEMQHSPLLNLGFHSCRRSHETYPQKDQTQCHCHICAVVTCHRLSSCGSTSVHDPAIVWGSDTILFTARHEQDTCEHFRTCPEIFGPWKPANFGPEAAYSRTSLVKTWMFFGKSRVWVRGPKSSLATCTKTLKKKTRMHEALGCFFQSWSPVPDPLEKAKNSPYLPAFVAFVTSVLPSHPAVPSGCQTMSGGLQSDVWASFPCSQPPSWLAPAPLCWSTWWTGSTWGIGSLASETWGFSEKKINSCDCSAYPLPLHTIYGCSKLSCTHFWWIRVHHASTMHMQKFRTVSKLIPHMLHCKFSQLYQLSYHLGSWAGCSSWSEAPP